MKRMLLCAACAIVICGTACARTRAAIATEFGVASYYHPHYSGLVAAHKTLPLGTRVKVVNLANRRSVILKIVDRGPFIRGRVIDVSPAAARALGFRGLAHVRIEQKDVSHRKLTAKQNHAKHGGDRARLIKQTRTLK